MTIEEIQYEAQGIMQEWGSNDSAPYVEFVEKLASMKLSEPSLPSNLDEAAEKYCSDNTPLGAICRACFRDGAEWMAGQGLNAKKEVEL